MGYGAPPGHIAGSVPVTALQGGHVCEGHTNFAKVFKCQSTHDGETFRLSDVPAQLADDPLATCRRVPNDGHDMAYWLCSADGHDLESAYAIDLAKVIEAKITKSWTQFGGNALVTQAQMKTFVENTLEDGKYVWNSDGNADAHVAANHAIHVNDWRKAIFQELRPLAHGNRGMILELSDTSQ